MSAPNVLTPELRALIDECAEAYVEGVLSSAEAFARIDRAIGSGWHGNPINAAREHFDWQVQRIVERDLMSPTPDQTQCSYREAGVWCVLTAGHTGPHRVGNRWVDAITAEVADWRERHPGWQCPHCGADRGDGYCQECGQDRDE